MVAEVIAGIDVSAEVLDVAVEVAGKQVPAKTKSLRWRKVMERQVKISERVHKRRVGRTEKVLIERFDEESGFWIGRSAMDAPEVDGSVYVSGILRPGEFTEVRILDSSAYDARGAAIGNGEPRSHVEHEVESIHAKRS